MTEHFGGLSVPIITWQELHDCYHDVDQDYFLAVLRYALDNYATLVSKMGNEHAFRTGSSLLADYLSGDPGGSSWASSTGCTAKS